MKKFLLLSFLMVAFVSAVSYAQTRTITRYYYSNADRPRLSLNASRIVSPNEPPFFSATSSVDLLGLPQDVTVSLISISVLVAYDDGDYYDFYESESETGTYIGYTLDFSREINYITFYADVVLSNGHYETYKIEDVYGLP